MSLLKTESKRIVKKEGVCGGSPVIEGTRIRVMDVVECYEFLKYSPEKIAKEFNLTLVQVFSALTYYYEHPKEINDEIREHTDFVQKLKGNGRN